MKPNTFYEALEDSGMVDTRRLSLNGAMSVLHSSIGAMDDRHLRIMAEDFPEILNAARTYAAHEHGLNRFENVKIVEGKAVTTG